MSAKRGQPMAEAVQWPPGTIQSHCGAVAPLAVSLSCAATPAPPTHDHHTVINSGRCLELRVVKRINCSFHNLQHEKTMLREALVLFCCCSVVYLEEGVEVRVGENVIPVHAKV